MRIANGLTEDTRIYNDGDGRMGEGCEEMTGQVGRSATEEDVWATGRSLARVRLSGQEIRKVIDNRQGVRQVIGSA